MTVTACFLLLLLLNLIPPQVKVLELESQLENERLRLGELRKKHYDIAGVALDQMSEGNGDAPARPNPSTMSPKPSKPALMKKPALAQKPTPGPKVVVRRCFRAVCEIQEGPGAGDATPPNPNPKASKQNFFKKLKKMPLRSSVISFFL